MSKKGYSELFCAICSVLDIDGPRDEDAKFKGLLSRVSRAIKTGQIDFSYNEKGKRYINVNKLRVWSRSYIDEFPLLEDAENKKLENQRKQNSLAIKRLNIESESELLVKAEKQIKETEAKKRAAEKTNQKKKEAESYCIKIASELWQINHDDEDDIYRVTGMSQILLDDLQRQPGIFHPKTIKTIKNWLKAAEKNGKLIIPEAAKRPGRPKKQN